MNNNEINFLILQDKLNSIINLIESNDYRDQGIHSQWLKLKLLFVNLFLQTELDYVRIRFDNRTEFYFKSEYTSSKNKEIKAFYTPGVYYFT